MKPIEDFRLTKDVTVGMIRNWMDVFDTNSKAMVIEFIAHRFTNRYIKHLACIDSGFLKMAISCLTIETLESFKQGLPDTDGVGRKTFDQFFQSESDIFLGFHAISNDFYYSIRCGILHQSETTNGWRILRDGSNLLDHAERSINADKFVEALKLSLESYLNLLRSEDGNSQIWKNAIIKLNDICDNCNVTKHY